MTGRCVSTVLSTGVAATACALFAARSGPVVLAGSPLAGRVTAVESVPAPTLLPLELGVPPELDVGHLVRIRTVNWGRPGAAPRRTGLRPPGPGALDARWQRVAADARITVVPRAARPAGTPGRRVDATGTRALTAVAVVRRPGAWTAATVTLPRGTPTRDCGWRAAPEATGTGWARRGR